MKLNTLKPADGARQDPRRVGRGIGSGLGKTCGRGHKGSFARSGKGKIKAGFEGGQMPMQRRLPKIGFRSKSSNDTAEVLLYQLDKLPAGDVDFAALRAAKLVPRIAKRAKIVLQWRSHQGIRAEGRHRHRGCQGCHRSCRRQFGGVRHACRETLLQCPAWPARGSSPNFVAPAVRAGCADRLPDRLLHSGPRREPGGDAADDGGAEGHHRRHVQHVLGWCVVRASASWR